MASPSYQLRSTSRVTESPLPPSATLHSTTSNTITMAQPTAAAEAQRRLNEAHDIAIEEARARITAAKAVHDQQIAAEAATIQANLNALISNTAAINAARVIAIRAAQVINAAPLVDVSTLPASSVHLHYRYLGIPHDELLHIWKGTFQVLNVSKLLIDLTRDTNPDKHRIVNGLITSNNKGTRKDYTSPKVWLGGFRNHNQILLTL